MSPRPAPPDRESHCVKGHRQATKRHTSRLLCFPTGRACPIRLELSLSRVFRRSGVAVRSHICTSRCCGVRDAGEIRPRVPPCRERPASSDSHINSSSHKCYLCGPFANCRPTAVLCQYHHALWRGSLRCSAPSCMAALARPNPLTIVSIPPRSPGRHRMQSLPLAHGWSLAIATST